MVKTRARGSILLPVTIILMALSGVVIGLNVFLKSTGDHGEYQEGDLAYALAREAISLSLQKYAASGTAAFPWATSMWWNTGAGWFGPSCDWEAETNDTAFPDNRGRIKCTATTQRRGTITMYATLYVNSEGGSTYYRYYRHSLRTTAR